MTLALSLANMRYASCTPDHAPSTLAPASFVACPALEPPFLMKCFKQCNLGFALRKRREMCVKLPLRLKAFKFPKYLNFYGSGAIWKIEKAYQFAGYHWGKSLRLTEEREIVEKLL